MYNPKKSCISRVYYILLKIMSVIIYINLKKYCKFNQHLMRFLKMYTYKSYKYANINIISNAPNKI